jgi:ClpP class serine protease
VSPATLLTPSLLRVHRGGVAVAAELGMPLGIRAKRPVGFSLRAFGGVAVAPSAVPEPPPEPLTAIVEVRGVLEQRASAWSCGETDGYDAVSERFFGYKDRDGTWCPGALTDENVAAVVLDVDSPGGDVPGLEQTIARLRAGIVASGKPCVGYVNELAASAACWLVLGVCDAVVLPPSGRIGSVGCVVLFQTETRHLVEEDKIDTYVARQPAGKMRPNPVEPLDEIGQARLDLLAVQGEASFVAAISSLRGLAPEAIRAWNGQIFTGADAVTVGLADQVGSLEDAVEFARSMAGMRAAA